MNGEIKFLLIFDTRIVFLLYHTQKVFCIWPQDAKISFHLNFWMFQLCSVHVILPHMRQLTAKECFGCILVIYTTYVMATRSSIVNIYLIWKKIINHKSNHNLYFFKTFVTSFWLSLNSTLFAPCLVGSQYPYHCINRDEFTLCIINRQITNKWLNELYLPT